MSRAVNKDFVCS